MMFQIIAYFSRFLLSFILPAGFVLVKVYAEGYHLLKHLVQALLQLHALPGDDKYLNGLCSLRLDEEIYYKKKIQPVFAQFSIPS